MSSELPQSIIDAVLRYENLERAEELINRHSWIYLGAQQQCYMLLQSVIKENKIEMAKLLITSGFPVNSPYKSFKNGLLHIACDKQNQDIVEVLLNNGAAVNERNKNGEAPLHFAVKRSMVKAVELLLKLKANVNVADKNGVSPIFLAITRPVNLRIVKLLLNFGANVNCVSISNKGYTPLHKAVETKNTKIVHLLLNRGAIVNMIAGDGYTPLHLACQWYLSDIIEILLNNGANPRAVSVSENFTPLHLACKHCCSYETVKFLLNKGAPVNALTTKNETPLCLAYGYGDIQISILLLENGADPNISPVDQDSVLFKACERGDVTMVDLFLEKGAIVNYKAKYNATPLHIACIQNNAEIVRLLLNKDADVNAQSDEQTPLHIACEKGYVEIVRLLLSKDPDLTVVDQDRQSPIKIACANKSIEIIRLLLAKGANTHADFEYTFTPLCTAVAFNNTTAIEELLNYGVDINEGSGEFMFTPLQHAVDENSGEIVALLLNRGADVEALGKVGRTPLQLAIDEPFISVSMVSLLLENKAKIYNKNDSNNFLLKTILKRNWPKFEQIIKYCKDINIENNKQCLITAVLDDNDDDDDHVEKIIAALLEHGLHVETEDVNNVELLRAAIRRELLPIVEDFMKLGAGANVVHDRDSGVTPLHLTAGHKGTDIAQLLISYGANINANDKQGKTPISYAVLKRNLKLMNLLISHGAPVNVNLLNIALVQKHGEIIEKILRNGVDINAYDENGITPLHAAVFRESPYKSCKSFVKMILAKGAFLEARTHGKNVIQHAFTYGYHELHTAILNCDKLHGRDVNVRTGFTALHIAVLEGDLDAVDMLLESGAKVDSELVYGMTALYMAALLGHHKIVRLLLEYEADVNIRDDLRKTPLRMACEGGHLKAVKLLVKYGADEKVKCFNNMTPLEFAEEGSLNCCCKCLCTEEVGKYCSKNLYAPTVDWLQGHRWALKNGFSINFAFNFEFRRSTKNMFKNTTISHTDILTKDINLIAGLAKNEQIVECVMSKEFQNKYDLYGYLFKINIRKGTERNFLLASACKTFYSLFDSITPELPQDCVEKIFANLSNEELRLFIKPMKF